MKSVTFSLREQGEVIALHTIIGHFEKQGLTDILWRTVPSPVNTDFQYSRFEKAFAEYPKVAVMEMDAVHDSEPVFGFKTDMHHVHDDRVNHFFAVSEIAASRLYRKFPLRKKNERSVIVVGNMKVESPLPDFQEEVLRCFAATPYTVVIVPRHPLTKDQINKLALPGTIELRNTMGELESLYACADLAVMGRIFDRDGLQPQADHNPIEATNNGHALCGLTDLDSVHPAFQWLYKESNLLHQCATYNEVFSLIPDLIHDITVDENLTRRQEWIEQNRCLYLQDVQNIILQYL